MDNRIFKPDEVTWSLSERGIIAAYEGLLVISTPSDVEKGYAQKSQRRPFRWQGDHTPNPVNKTRISGGRMGPIFSDCFRERGKHHLRV